MSKLLILDDSEDLLEAMKFFLEKKGYQVHVSSNKEKLFEDVISFHPDLIILDVFIHGQDSRKLCKDLRSNFKTKYLCIVLFSSSTNALADYSIHGADGCLEKPFGLNSLLEKIEEVLHVCRDKAN